MEKIYYKSNLEDLTNRQLDLDYQNLFIENRIENYPEELEEHHEIVHNAEPNNKLQPAESRIILFNYMRDYHANRQATARRRLGEGRKSKKIRRRKTKKIRRRKTKKNMRSKV